MADTIAAIATPQAAGGIGIVRISGDEAAAIADRVFNSADGKPLTLSKGYTAHYGYVYDGSDKTPTVTVTLDGKTLKKDTDYAVIYQWTAPSITTANYYDVDTGALTIPEL